MISLYYNIRYNYLKEHAYDLNKVIFNYKNIVGLGLGLG